MGLENFNVRLANARKEKGYTQEEFAMRLGVTPQAISKWERGGSLPDIGLMDSIASVLKCSLNYLFDHNNDDIIFTDSDENERKEQINELLMKDAIKVEFGVKLIDMLIEENENRYVMLHNIRKKLADQYGVTVPTIRLRDNITLDDYEYNFSIYGRIIEKGMLYYPKNFIIGGEKNSEDDIPAIEPLYGLNGVWRTKSSEEDTENKVKVSAFSYICTHLQACILRNYNKIINRQIVSDMVDLVRSKYPAAVNGVVPELVSLPLLQKVIKKLLDRHVSVNNLFRIIEILEENIPITQDIDQLTDIIADSFGESDWI